MSDTIIEPLRLIVVFLMGVMLGDSIGTKYQTVSQDEAVERGFAEWVSDEQGNTTFKWKEVAK